MAMQVTASHTSDGTRELTQPTPAPRPGGGKPCNQEFKTPARPSMTEMLKDIGSVKLRTVDAVR